MTVPRSLAEARAMIARERYRRKLAAITVRHNTPPDAREFGAFGTGTVIVPPSRIATPGAIFLGSNVTILENAFVSVVAAVDGHAPRLTIGDRTSIGVQVHIACVGEIDIGPDVLTAPRVFIGDTYHRYQDPDLPIIAQPMAVPEKVVIGAGSFLGIGSAVLMGVTVGEHTYVSAGAVVTHDVEPFTVVVGNPARPVRRWDSGAGEWRRV